ncbi:MAG: peptidase C39 [Alphaproteobacteria bacterium]|nr:peptidase C39 [Alphaproteobacteria bacterium]
MKGARYVALRGSHPAKISRRLKAVAAACLVAAGVGAPSASAEQLLIATGNVNAQIDIASLASLRYATVVRQQYDFSCGSAALATLLTYHYGRETSEQDAFTAMWEIGDQDRIRQLGFSLFEMKAYIESLGLLADGFNLSLDRVAEIGVPGIALIDDSGYKHFVVIKGVTKRNVLVGDSAKGLRVVPRQRFADKWDGTIFFIRSDLETGKANFNKADDWRYAPGAPFDRARDSLVGLQASTLQQTRPSWSGFSATSLFGEF